MKIEASRAFSREAAHYLNKFDSEGHAIGAMSKVFCGELLFTAVFKTMQAMGVNALDRKHPLERFLREASHRITPPGCIFQTSSASIAGRGG
jgi:alkylation response protein AidB-like acyl-CoA dehydrogenase